MHTWQSLHDVVGSVLGGVTVISQEPPEQTLR